MDFLRDYPVNPCIVSSKISRLFCSGRATKKINITFLDHFFFQLEDQSPFIGSCYEHHHIYPSIYLSKLISKHQRLVMKIDIQEKKTKAVYRNIFKFFSPLRKSCCPLLPPQISDELQLLVFSLMELPQLRFPQTAPILLTPRKAWRRKTDKETSSRGRRAEREVGNEGGGPGGTGGDRRNGTSFREKIE